jgi:MFS family permease
LQWSLAARSFISWPNAFHLVGLRAFVGLCVASLFMVVLSWLNDQVVSETRGRIFGLYESLLRHTAGLYIRGISGRRALLEARSACAAKPTSAAS